MINGKRYRASETNGSAGAACETCNGRALIAVTSGWGPCPDCTKLVETNPRGPSKL
jgi:hypothetical protein